MPSYLSPTPREPALERLLRLLGGWLLPPSLTTLQALPPLSRAAEPTEELEALLESEEEPFALVIEEEAEAPPSPSVDPDAATVLHLPAAAFATLVPSALDWAEEEPPLERKSRRLKG